MFLDLSNSPVLTSNAKRPSVWLMILSGQPKIVSDSLGIDNISNVKNGYSIRVNGTKYVGGITVTFDETINSFKVDYSPDSNPDASETLETIPFGELAQYGTRAPASIDAETIETIRSEYGFIKM